MKIGAYPRKPTMTSQSTKWTRVLYIILYMKQTVFECQYISNNHRMQIFIQVHKQRQRSRLVQNVGYDILIMTK